MIVFRWTHWYKKNKWAYQLIDQKIRVSIWTPQIADNLLPLCWCESQTYRKSQEHSKIF